MTFWNQLRLAGGVIVAVMALAALLAALLSTPTHQPLEPKPAPRVPQPSTSLLPPGGTSGL